MSEPRQHIQRHRDGSLCAKGETVDGLAHGYWEWFRKDGSIMRSGWFEQGRQTGEWTTYDRTGRPHKVTMMKPKPAGADTPLTRV
jgi:antitoxin component YwqK of YwqJK toxin-antitoxin module